MIGPGLPSSSASASAPSPAADAAATRSGPKTAEPGGAPSAFDRLMAPSDGGATATPAKAADREGDSESTASTSETPADPGALLAMLALAAGAPSPPVAPGTAAGGVGPVAATAGPVAGATTGSLLGTAALAAGAPPSTAAAAGLGGTLLPADLLAASPVPTQPNGALHGAAMAASPATGAASAAPLATLLASAPDATAPGAPGTGPGNAPEANTLLELAALAGGTDADATLAPGKSVDPAGAPAWLATQVAAPTPTPSAAAVAPTPVLAMPTDPGEGFDDGLATQVSWMASHGLGEARIRVTPDHLGTIDLVINLDGHRLSAEFQSPHADVRHALEGGLARLRDQLAQHGLQLVQAQVGDGSDPRRAPRRDDAPAPATGADASQADAAMTPAAPAPRLRRARLLDTYA